MKVQLTRLPNGQMIVDVDGNRLKCSWMTESIYMATQKLGYTEAMYELVEMIKKEYEAEVKRSATLSEIKDIRDTVTGFYIK
jgi:hypothetical protein